MRLKHILEAQQFNPDWLVELFKLTRSLRTRRSAYLEEKIIAMLFYEPSTRTRFSFESATLSLGGNVIGTENAGVFSSAIKGESLEDSIRIVSGYTHAIVLRHTENDAARQASAVSSVPIINAGCGTGQHPTQALVDLFTIYDHRGEIDGLNIALVGDLANGRTIRSLAYLLGKYNHVHITFVAPALLRVGNDILEYLTRHNVGYALTENLDDVVHHVDVIYSTRVQMERLNGLSGIEKARLEASYRMNAQRASRMKKGAIIMHPLPRNTEIATEVDRLPQARYFEQAQNGLYVRRALLAELFS